MSRWFRVAPQENSGDKEACFTSFSLTKCVCKFDFSLFILLDFSLAVDEQVTFKHSAQFAHVQVLSRVK